MFQRWKPTPKRALAALGIVSVGLNIVALTTFGTLARVQNQPIKPISKDSDPTTLAGPRLVGSPLTGEESAENKEEFANREHPAEQEDSAASSSSVIEFLNSSSAQIAIFQLTQEGERQPSGELAPAASARFSTKIGTRWLVTDDRHNALAIFLADAQSRTLIITDAQLEDWKRQLTQDHITIRGDHGETLHTFCMGPDDHVYALLTMSQSYGEVSTTNELEDSHTGEVRVFSPDGTKVRRFSLDFTPHRIAVAPDGEMIVGGVGVIARFTPEGNLLSKHLPPNLEGAERDWSSAAAQAREENILECNQQIALLEEQARAHQAHAELFAERINSQKQKLDSLQKQSTDEAIQELKQSLGGIYAVTASAEALYVATRMPTGFGFAIWKMKRDATDGKQIVENLSGCCGLIDIQANGDGLFVAENSRHRVLKFDSEGKKIAQFGRRNRGGEGDGFTGCCNPMNLCFAPNGDLFTAETDGKIKRFTSQGEFVSTIAAFQGAGGCLNVAIGAAKNRDRVFYLDLTNSQLVTAKITDGATAPGG